MPTLRAFRAAALALAPAAVFAPAVRACPPSSPGVVVKCPPTWTLLEAAPPTGVVLDKSALLGAAPAKGTGEVAPTLPTLAPGDTLRGTLGAGDAARGPLVRLDVAAGQRYTVALASADFDAFLALGTLADESDAAAFDATQTDDDSGGGTNARLVFTADASGAVYVRVAALSDDESGAFALSLVPTTAAAPHAITPGETVQGSLDADDAVLGDGSFADLYTFTAAAGEAFEITLASDDFDAYVSVGTGLASAFEEIDHNDDGNGPDDGTHARLAFTAPSAGTYVIGANSLAAGETGRYRLRIERR